MRLCQAWPSQTFPCYYTLGQALHSITVRDVNDSGYVLQQSAGSPCILHGIEAMSGDTPIEDVLTETERAK